MGLRLVCDECGKGLDTLDRTQISRASLSEGNIQLDLCDDCASPILAMPLVVKKQKEQKEKVKVMTEQAKNSSGPVPVTGPTSTTE